MNDFLRNFSEHKDLYGQLLRIWGRTVIIRSVVMAIAATVGWLSSLAAIGYMGLFGASWQWGIVILFLVGFSGITTSQIVYRGGTDVDTPS